VRWTEQQRDGDTAVFQWAFSLSTSTTPAALSLSSLRGVFAGRMPVRHTKVPRYGQIFPSKSHVRGAGRGVRHISAAGASYIGATRTAASEAMCSAHSFCKDFNAPASIFVRECTHAYAHSRTHRSTSHVHWNTEYCAKSTKLWPYTLIVSPRV
jgi:hypothetical protein